MVLCTAFVINAGTKMQRLNAAVTFVARKKVNFVLLVLFLDAFQVCWTQLLLWLGGVTLRLDIFFELFL